MDDIKLKPCPFCGGEVELIYDEDMDDYRIDCKICEMAMIPPGEEPGAVATKDGAIKAWNRRVGDD